MYQGILTTAFEGEGHKADDAFDSIKHYKLASCGGNLKIVGEGLITSGSQAPAARHAAQARININYL